MAELRPMIIIGGIGTIALILIVVLISSGHTRSNTTANIAAGGIEDENGDIVSVTMSPFMSPSMPSAKSKIPETPIVSPRKTLIPNTSVPTTPHSSMTPPPPASPSLTATPAIGTSPSPTTVPVTDEPSPSVTVATNEVHVVFNEIAWSGTKAGSADEWIELYNAGTTIISVDGWKIHEGNDGTVVVTLTGTIEPGAFFLIERSDQKTVNDIEAPIARPFGGSGLNNNGEKLTLFDDAGAIIDGIDCSGGWFSGSASPTYMSMERKSLSGSSNDPQNWADFNGIGGFWHDADGNPINGTPEARNSVAMD